MDAKTWEQKEHSRVKHSLLKAYLGAWFQIIGRKFDHAVYVDCFCGPGSFGENDPGSPLIAIESGQSVALPPRKKFSFLFVDQDRKCVASLRNTLRTITLPDNFDVHVKCGSAVEIIGKELVGLKRLGFSDKPLFAFIDPFGFKGVPFKLIENLLAGQSREIFVNFMVEHINRFIKHPNDAISSHVIEAIGTSECLKLIQDSSNRLRDLRMLYQSQLQTCAKYVRFFEMRTTVNRPLYCLFFATNNSLGHMKMKEAMWRMDPLQGTSFCDSTDPHQLTMIEDESTHLLASLLEARYRGCTSVNVDGIKNFVREETIFIDKHIRAALNQLEEVGKLHVHPVKLNGKNRRAQTYSEGVLVDFL